MTAAAETSGAVHLDLPLLDHADLDLAGAASATFLITQRFGYAYDAPVVGLSHRLVAVPRARHGSLLRRLSSVSVAGVDGAVTSTRPDRFGNPVTRVRVPRVAEWVEFRVASVVERTGPVRPAVAPSWALRDRRLLDPTRLTAPDAAILDLARSAAAAATGLELAEALCAEVRSRVAYAYDVTDVGTPAAAALAGGRGVCQDSAHVMLALCRAAGLPARYVSGHLLGEGGTHAWVEVVLPDGDEAAAVGFDPCNGCRAGAGHLPVAGGRDYADVAPTSGTYASGGSGRLTASKRVGVTAVA